MGASSTENRDRLEAVEAVTLLVAVERRAHLGDRPSLTGQRRHEDLPWGVVEDHHLVSISPLCPRFFDEAPTCFDLSGEAGGLRTVGEFEYVVGYADSAGGLRAFVVEEPCWHLA